MAQIFLSYRRRDSQGWAARLSAELRRAFGIEPVFFDLGSIAAGQDFVDAIEDAVAACKVLLALIGPSWTDARFANGKRRLLDPADIVRIEIATAMRRNVTVLPILLGGAQPPNAHELPDELTPLARRNAFELSDVRWDYDCDRLLDRLAEITGLRRHPVDERPSRTSVSVLDQGMFEAVEAGDVTGVRGRHLPAGGLSVDVARQATIRRSKLGDISGIVSTERRKRDRTS